MKSYIIILITTLFLLGCTSSEESDKKAIISVLKIQEQAWSNYDLESFMNGYWKNDSLKFYGSNGLTYGWQSTLNNYKKRYPTQEHTGTLTFSTDAITKIEKEVYYVMGRYFLKRKIGDAQGVFIIIFKKINGEWKIIADMSC